MMGPVGAAFSTLISLILIGIVRVIQVQYILKINFFSIKLIKPFVVSGITTTLLLIVKSYIVNFNVVLTLLLATLICLGTYLILMGFRLENEDKEFLKGLKIIRKTYSMIELIKKNYFVCVGIFLSIVLLVIFNEIFFDNKTFGSSDNLSPKAVGLALNEVMEKEGGYPHWQPWVFSGMPTAEAFTNISQLYFPEYLFKIFSVPGMFIQISHFLFCGIGMVLLLRYLGCSYWSSLLGSIGFMITPYM